MARRHKSLIPLSQDHYNGLLLAQQIQAPGRVIMPGWPADPDAQTGFVEIFFREHLHSHFHAEEESLFPQVIRHVPAARQLVDRLLKEHREMERFATEFGRGKIQNPVERLSDFSRLLEGHIRAEERELFPMFESQAPAEVLEQVGHLLHRDDSGHSPGDQ